MKLATARETAALDRLAAEECGIPVRSLMEGAGEAVAEAAAALLGEPAGARIVLLCGRGNNGGDGLVAARLLRERGALPLVCLLGALADLRGEPAAVAAAALEAGVPVVEIRGAEELAGIEGSLRGAALVVDALFGTGFAPPARGLAAGAIAVLNRTASRVLAVDIPSGLSADHGRIEGEAVRADATVTFGLAKPGLLLYPAARNVGRLWVADIGFPPGLEARLPLARHISDPAALRSLLRPRDPEGHKGTYGHVLIVAGSTGYAGAAALTARGALRAGAGLVTVGMPSAIAPPALPGLPEAMTLPLPDGGCGVLGVGALEAVLAGLEGKRALALGPGLSRDPDAAAFVRGLLARLGPPVVVDADALAALAAGASPLPGGDTRAVVTPHPGEMARLLGTSVAEVQGRRLEAAAECARRLGAVTVLKGARTVVAAPEGETWINLTGNPAMAAGGMGDVLTGVIAAHLARGLPPLEAALLGVHLHGAAGDIAARRAPWGILAGEVADLVPAAARELLAGGPDGEGAQPRRLSLLVP